MGGRAVFDNVGSCQLTQPNPRVPTLSKGDNLPAAAVVAVAVRGGHSRSWKYDHRPYGHPLVTAGHRGHRPRVTSGSAMGRWARRNQRIEANALTRCQAPSKSHRSTRSQHLRRCLAPTWRSECYRGLPRGARREEGRVEARGSTRTRHPCRAGVSPAITLGRRSKNKERRTPARPRHVVPGGLGFLDLCSSFFDRPSSRDGRTTTGASGGARNPKPH